MHAFFSIMVSLWFHFSCCLLLLFVRSFVSVEVFFWSHFSLCFYSQMEVIGALSVARQEFVHCLSKFDIYMIFLYCIMATTFYYLCFGKIHDQPFFSEINVIFFVFMLKIKSWRLKTMVSLEAPPTPTTTLDLMRLTKFWRKGPMISQPKFRSFRDHILAWPKN